MEGYRNMLVVFVNEQSCKVAVSDFTDMCQFSNQSFQTRSFTTHVQNRAMILSPDVETPPSWQAKSHKRPYAVKARKSNQ